MLRVEWLGRDHELGGDEGEAVGVERRDGDTVKAVAERGGRSRVVMLRRMRLSMALVIEVLRWRLAFVHLIEQDTPDLIKLSSKF